METRELAGKRAFAYMINGTDYGFSWDTRDQRTRVMIELLKLGLTYKGVGSIMELAPNTCRHEVRLFRKKYGIKQRVKRRNVGPVVATHWQIPARLYAMLSRYAKAKGTPIYIAAVDVMTAGFSTIQMSEKETENAA